MAITLIKDYKITQKLNANSDLLQLLPETRTSNVLQETSRRFVEEHLVRLGGTYSSALSAVGADVWSDGVDVNTWSAIIQQTTQAGNIVLTLPASSGTLALTTDLPTIVAQDGLLDGTYTAGTISFEPHASAGAGLLSYTNAPTVGTTDLSYSGYFYTNRLNNMVITSTGGSRTLDLGGNFTTNTGNVVINAQVAGSTLNLPTSSTISALTSGHVLYASAANTISGEAQLAVSRGGTGVATAAQNTVFAGPTSGTGAPSFRTLVNGDIPTTLSITELTLSGDLAVNGGDITSTATTFNLLNSGVTTLNLGGAAAVNISKTGSTTTIKGTLDVDQATTLKSTLKVNAATTLDTTLAVTGISTLTGLLNANGGIAVDTNNFTVSGTTGDVLTAGDLAVNGGDITSTATTFNLLNNTVTTLNLGGAADINLSAIGKATLVKGSLEVDGTTQLDGITNINNALNVTGLSSLDGGIDVNGLVTINSSTGNIVTSGDLAVNGGDITSSAATFNVGSSVTTLNLGSVAGSVVIPGNLTVQGTNTILNTTTVSTEDNIILLRSSAPVGAMTGYAGLVAHNYDAEGNDGGLLFDNAGIAYVGDVTLDGSGLVIDDTALQAIATREATIVDGNLIKWDASGLTLVDQGDYLSNDAITIAGGTDLENGGTFTLNQHGNETITINHSNVTRTNPTSVVDPGYDGTFTVIDSITTSATGHVTSVNTKTVTMPDVHPSHPGDDIDVDTGALTGATIISDIDFNVTTDTFGHVTDANGVIATRELTLGDLGYVAPGDATIGIAAGSGLTNGGSFTTNQTTNATITVNLGTPSTLSSTSTNSTSATSHQHGITNGALTGTANVISVTGGGKVLDSATAINLITGYGDTINPYTSKTANTFLAAPNGSAGVPSFRAMQNEDLPDTAVTPGTYTAVDVNQKGVVTGAGFSIEVGVAAQTEPDPDLIIGGLFFMDVTA